MILGLGEILLFFLAAAAGIYIFQAQKVREVAISAARRGCRQHGYQLLDESVSICRLSMSRDEKGRWRFWRQYRFEYSDTGEDRRRGHVIMLGDHLQALIIGEPTLH